MEKLSFGFALALICIFIFSCEDKSIVNPQNDEFKITRISSQSGFEGSAITLYGKNLKSSSFAAIEIGGYQAKIISLTDDSLVILVPQLPVGSHKFEILSKANKIMFLTDFDINLNHDFKINNISSTTGYVNSLVVLYGENLDNSSTMTVKFGDQQAEILAKTKDSITVKVPKLTNGLYDINIKNIFHSLVLPQKYQVIPIDFSLYKNYELKIKGLILNLFYNHKFSDETMSGSGGQAWITNPYDTFYFNKYSLECITNAENSYQILEKMSNNGKETNNSISFVFDDLNNKIISLNLDFHKSSESQSTYTRNVEVSYLKFCISDIDISFSNNYSTISVKLSKDEILKKMTNFDIGHLTSLSEWQYHNRYDEDSMTLKDFLGANDDATIEIKFTK